MTSNKNYRSFEKANVSNSEKDESEQQLLDSDDDSNSYQELDGLCAKNEYTTTEVISMLGFGRAQLGTLSVFVSTYFSQFLLVNMMAYFSTRLYVELGLTAEMESALSVASFSGFAFCHLFWGWVADRFGRRIYALGSSLWIVFWSLLCVVAPTYGWLIAFRLFYSLAGGATNILQPGMYELIPVEYHWTAFVLGNQWGGAASRSMPPIVAALIFTDDSPDYDWRIYLLIMSLPAVINVFIVGFCMYETPRYLLSQDKADDALQVLNQIAKTNGRSLPKNLILIEDEELAKAAEENLSLYDKIKIALANNHIKRALAGNILIGIAVRYFTISIRFVKTELIYLNGETETDYCSGTYENTYLLDGKDYLFLIACQIASDIISCSTLVFQNRIKVGLRFLGIFGYGVSFIILLCLFLCPSAWAAVAMISVVQIFNYNLIVSVMLTMSGLLPTNIRASLLGICGFLMYVPLPLMPYVVQTMAKVSMHYVTGLSLGVCALAFVGSAILPTEIYAN